MSMTRMMGSKWIQLLDLGWPRMVLNVREGIIWIMKKRRFFKHGTARKAEYVTNMLSEFNRKWGWTGKL